MTILEEIKKQTKRLKEMVGWTEKDEENLLMQLAQEDIDEQLHLDDFGDCDSLDEELGGDPDIDGMAQDQAEWADEHGAVCTEKGWEI